MVQKLSPQQIQLMKLLQIPTVSLEQRIKEELEVNPALEEGDTAEDENYDNQSEEFDKENETEFELDDYLNEYIEDDPSSYKLSVPVSTQEEDRSYPVAVQNSFHEYLEGQLGMLELEDEMELKVAKQVIGSIDDDGYLRREPSAIMDDLLFSQNVEVTETEIIDILKRIQEFDPPGVGARSLQECLLLQLLAKKGRPGADLHSEDLAEKILTDYFDEFTKKHYIKLKKYLGVSDIELKDAIGEILKLNPKPSSGHSGGQGQNNLQYIIPDFIITNQDGELELSLNTRNAPDLRINDQYLEMLSTFKDSKKKGAAPNRKDKEVVMFVKQKIDSAKWFIDAIRQRQDTLYRCMYAIMQFQYEFFMTGDQKKLRPMILKDIAEITALDISTVSRVANSKFVQTEFGNLRLKELFSESLQTQDGEEVSTLEVKKILTDVIAQEDKRKPLSDEKLKNILLEKGYNIARRTIAKYREQLNVPVARLRKEL